MSILYGLYRADAGEIRIDGPRGSPMESPHDAIAQGIGMVHQHFMLVDTFTVLEKPGAGRRGRSAAGPAALAAARAEAGAAGPRIRACRSIPIRAWPICRSAKQQRVEILKVLFRGRRVS